MTLEEVIAALVGYLNDTELIEYLEEKGFSIELPDDCPTID